MYRPNIKVFDCTIRDGGLANNSHFELETVRAVYKACCEAGVDYIELGYRNSTKMFSPQEYGLWRFCDEEVLKRVVDGIEPRDSKISIMQDSHKASVDDVPPKDKSVVDMIRVATYVKDIDKAIRFANNATDKGYQSTINIMAVSHEGSPFLDEALQQIEEETKVLAVYVVDSFGSLYSETIHYLIEKFQMYLKTKEVGIHAHNNLQLAFANTIEAIVLGANLLDATMAGLGRGAGNCLMELLLGFLHNPKYDLRPVLRCVQDSIEPMRQELGWGFDLPYMIVGQLNQHPRAAIKFNDTEPRGNIVRFYDTASE